MQIIQSKIFSLFISLFIFATSVYAGDATNVRTGVVYTNLQEAIDEAEPNDVLELEGKFIGSFDNDNISIILKGSLHRCTTLDAHENGRVFNVISNDTEGVIVKFENLTIQNGFVNGNGGGIANNGYNTVIIKNCVITNNQATNGGGISNASTLIIENSIIKNNTATNDGGGISFLVANPPFLTLTDSKVINNIAGRDGGGISAVNSTRLASFISFIDTKVNDNISQRQGGGIVSLNISYFAKNSEFKRNTTAFGGGIYDTASYMLFYNVHINNNTVSDEGGGIAGVQTILEFHDGTISYNSAGVVGGGIESVVGQFNLFHSKVEGNTAPQAGGFFLINNSRTYLKNVLVEKNRATESEGGGIYNGSDAGSTLTMEYTTLHKNIAQTLGGGLYNAGTAGLYICWVTENTANQGGGIYNDTGGILTLTKTEVKHNKPDNIFNTGTLND